MTVEPEVFPDAGALGAAAARAVADGLVAARRAGRPYVLGCPAGRSAASTYRALAGLVAAEGVPVDHLVVALVDEYLVPGEDGALVREVDGAPHSCVRFGREEVVRPLDEAAGADRGVRPEHLWVPDPADPGAYDARLDDVGGFDLLLLASGASDGHVAFNAAGSSRDSRTRVVALPDSTRRDNLATFPSFGDDLGRVPRHGVTVGVDTIAAGARSVLVLVHGSGKAEAARRLLAATGYDPTWPATIYAECARPRLLLDTAAVSAH